MTPTVLEQSFVATVGEGAQLVGAFLEISGIGIQIDTHEYAEGGNNAFVWRLRGRTRHPNVTLKSGLTDQAVLYEWASGGAISGPQDVHVFFLGPDRRVLQMFALLSASPVRWTGPSANIAANAVGTESLEIAHNGVVRVAHAALPREVTAGA
ncbi:MAG: hypothetical protein JWQ20_4087 [Conexibacter sp.]|nr:hypothetical protein [Solirubrobacterales bacterium]MCW3004789.1 hypothetical protein [Conexibacter sp.]